jgi:hypothetical protein
MTSECETRTDRVTEPTPYTLLFGFKTKVTTWITSVR